MRMRKHKHTEERLALCAELLRDPDDAFNGAWRGAWRKEFAVRMGFEPVRLELEIGCGKGGFILGMATREKDTAFVAVEVCREALLLAVEKAKAAELSNVLFLCMDAQKLAAVFAPGEVEKIYLNFSDPWPKYRHAKRRLTAPAFLKLYQTLLAPGGAVRQKTDNQGLFAYSLESFKENGWTLTEVTDDLHSSPWAEGNIMTEYEKTWSEKGFTIHALTAFPPENEA